MASSDPSATGWRKSSYSGGGNDDNCVEVAALATAIAIRDSKEPQKGALTMPRPSWTYFCTDMQPK